MFILADIGHGMLGVLLTLMANCLILRVLVQRGRGGGLAGALGGMGGSSAFGAKAGDVFTRITIGVAAIWILLCVAAAKWGTAAGSSNITIGNKSTANAPLDKAVDAEKTPAKEGDVSSAPATTAEAPAASTATPDTPSPPSDAGTTSAPAAIGDDAASDEGPQAPNAPK